ncbi:sensor histidine kinase [Tellurirhabdus rosea]|uniref:sensor histidine kinase n=1 Tax=Tellurirhabdus rosea TaxID=2674997 RepID=UPI00224EC48E|nr:7TM-DISM domain-containing protein [Tellurirhabdus rosea]
MRQVFWIYWLLVLGSYPGPTVAQVGPPVYPVNHRTVQCFFPQGLALFRDSTGRMNVEQVAARSRFRPTTSPVSVEGAAPHWIRFSVRNTESRPLTMLLEVGYSYFNEVQAFVLTDDRWVGQSPRLHWQTPFLARPVPHRYFVLPMAFAPEKTSTVYLKLRKEPGTHRLPVRLWKPAVFTQHALNDNTLWGGITGWLLFAVVWGAYLAISRHGSLYGLYSVYVFAHLGALMASEGVWGELYLDGQLGLRGIHVSDVFIGLIMGGNLLFLRVLLESKTYVPRWVYRLSNGVLLLWAFWLAGYFAEAWLIQRFGPASTGWKRLQQVLYDGKYLLYPPIFIFVISFIYLGLRQRVYLLAFVPIIFVAATFFLTNLLTPNQLVYVPMPVYGLTVVFETAVLMFGLAYRFKAYRDERERLLREQHQLTLNVQQDERRRLARDLHNQIGPDLAVLKLQMEKDEITLPKPLTFFVRAYITRLERIIHDVRGVSHALMPAELSQQGLVPSLTQFVEQLSGLPNGPEVNFTHNVAAPLPEQTSQLVFQVARELIHNSIKHAQASIIDLELYQQNGSLLLKVVDNGQGYDLSALDQRQVGIGLRSIQASIAKLDGNLEIHPNTGKGMSHKVILPIG